MVYIYNYTMKLLELFSGTQSIGREAETLGCIVTSLDINNKFASPTIMCDLLEWEYEDFPVPDMIWASCPCASFSRLNYTNKKPNRTKFGVALTETGRIGDALVAKTKEIIDYFLIKNPNMLWVIENPMGMMRIKLGKPSVTTSYCNYGFPYNKPTDFWSNFELKLEPQEYNWKKRCKEAGTEYKLAAYVPVKNRYQIPPKLCNSIMSQALCVFQKQSEISKNDQFL